MKLYLLRHGIAESMSRRPVDAERALTSAGRQQMALVACGMRRLGLRPAALVSSPFARARQTSEIVATELGLSGQLQESDLLLPHALPEETRGLLAAYSPRDELLLVGHEPLLSSLALLLCGCSIGSLLLNRGAICRIDLDDPAQVGALVWLLQPRALTLLARHRPRR